MFHWIRFTVSLCLHWKSATYCSFLLPLEFISFTFILIFSIKGWTLLLSSGNCCSEGIRTDCGETHLSWSSCQLPENGMKYYICYLCLWWWRALNCKPCGYKQYVGYNKSAIFGLCFCLLPYFLPVSTQISTCFKLVLTYVDNIVQWRYQKSQQRVSIKSCNT